MLNDEEGRICGGSRGRTSSGRRIQGGNVDGTTGRYRGVDARGVCRYIKLRWIRGK